MKTPTSASRRFLLITMTCGAAMICGHAAGYESDVHYGLTKWLALKGGYAEHESESIARGNQRVDSGGPQAIDVVIDYGCALPDAAASLRVQQAHTPSVNSVPAAPARRPVEPGSEAAKEQLRRVIQAAKGDEASMLSLLGAALHSYQDSWSHAGVSSAIDGGATMNCDLALAVSHPASKGGWRSHSSDLTFLHPDDAMTMAKMTYEQMTSFSEVKGRRRAAEPWSALDGELRQFVSARTKTQKRDWFASHGMPDVDLLGGISLPDGAEGGFERKRPPLLPALTSNVSSQHDVRQEVRDFFDGLLETWLTSAELEKSLTPYLSGTPKAKASELRGRLKLLRLRDHGANAVLAHKPTALSLRELEKINRLSAVASADARASSTAEAVLPLVTKGVQGSPLLPYITRDLPSAGTGASRAVAILRLKHAPYDAVGLVSEHAPTGWKLVDVVMVVDH